MPTPDPVWEEHYARGHQQRAPWDEVVTFVYRHMPRDREPNAIRILEVGCGTGGNLRFLAREGFDVCGVDTSPSAIATAVRRFAADGLAHLDRFTVGDFTQLPFDAGKFDLVIDRAALTYVGTSALRAAIGEIRRVLRPGGAFLFTPWADSDSRRRAGRPGPDDLTVDIRGGATIDAREMRFVSRPEIDGLLPATAWELRAVERVEVIDMLRAGSINAHWRVVAATR
jgi:SAM-dependent methyltransferase